MLFLSLLSCKQCFGPVTFMLDLDPDSTIEIMRRGQRDQLDCESSKKVTKIISKAVFVIS